MTLPDRFCRVARMATLTKAAQDPGREREMSDSTPQSRIAARMRATREAAGMSQEEVGRRLSVSMRTYARWERGESHGFLLRLGEIANAIGTTESDLLGGEDPLSAQPTVESLADKLDEVLSELAQLRDDLGPIVGKKRRKF